MGLTTITTQEGIFGESKKRAVGITSKNAKTERQMLEAKHNFQYFLLRQKTPPVTKNMAAIMEIRNRAR
jgi:hypothetical protein